MTGLLVNSLMTSMLVLAVSQPAKGSEETAQAAPVEQGMEARTKLLGRYNLRGVMETASGLELFEDGSFRWFLMVGGLDAFSGGSWSLQDDEVVMVYDPPEEGARYDPLGTVVMKIDGENLLPPQNFGGGAYIKIKPRSESD